MILKEVAWGRDLKEGKGTSSNMKSKEWELRKTLDLETERPLVNESNLSESICTVLEKWDYL